MLFAKAQWISLPKSALGVASSGAWENEKEIISTTLKATAWMAGAPLEAQLVGICSSGAGGKLQPLVGDVAGEMPSLGMQEGEEQAARPGQSSAHRQVRAPVPTGGAPRAPGSALLEQGGCRESSRGGSIN